MLIYIKVLVLTKLYLTKFLIKIGKTVIGYILTKRVVIFIIDEPIKACIYMKKDVISRMFDVSFYLRDMVYIIVVLIIIVIIYGSLIDIEINNQNCI